MHVRDVADANIAAYQSPRHGAIYNVGSGANISVKELADMISPDRVFAPRRPGDAEVTLADISRIRDELGWWPKIGFDEGLRDLISLMEKSAE